MSGLRLKSSYSDNSHCHIMWRDRTAHYNSTYPVFVSGRIQKHNLCVYTHSCLSHRKTTRQRQFVFFFSSMFSFIESWVKSHESSSEGVQISFHSASWLVRSEIFTPLCGAYTPWWAYISSNVDIDVRATCAGSGELHLLSSHPTPTHLTSISLTYTYTL